MLLLSVVLRVGVRKMKVICFKGKSNTGKSRIIKRILNEFFNIILIPKRKKDFSLCIPYNGKKIGICSYGDDLKLMEKWLKPLKEEVCDIIICTSRTKGKTLEFIRNSFGEENIDYIDCEWNKGESERAKDEENNERFLKFREKFERYFR